MTTTMVSDLKNAIYENLADVDEAVSGSLSDEEAADYYVFKEAAVDFMISAIDLDKIKERNLKDKTISTLSCNFRRMFMIGALQ